MNSARPQASSQLSLTSNWQFRQHDSKQAVTVLPADHAEGSGWLPAAVPGTVHQDLIAAGRIPDPFLNKNENDVQWIGEADWDYRCTFDVPDSLWNAEHIALCFDGLDTIATVWLNGEQILTSQNMFVPARVEVKKLLKKTGNEVFITFQSVVRLGAELAERYGTFAAWNGNANRVHIRKAQYHYGWDWGPCLITVGVWRPVYLQGYSARIADIHIPAEISADLATATLPVRVKIENPSAVQAVSIAVRAPDGHIVDQISAPVAGSEAAHTFQVARPALWYPHGYGQQPQYSVEVSLRTGDSVLDSRQQKIGLRRLRLVQEPLIDEPGKSFLFEINNIPIFCGGSNWIPSDSFTPRITPEKYRGLLQMAVDGNMTMLRIWGGGIYEEDVFYDLCDELGLLIWQDFMFACGMYPAHPEFQADVRAEAEANVTRLRHHASLVLWSGNNEDYQIAEALKVYDASFDGDFTQTAFPARAIYERLLPQICAALDPTRPYWPGSPYGGASVWDSTVGDRHSWEIWHGSMDDYRNYGKYSGRFVSEFGMQAFPDLPTLTAAITDPSQLTPESELIAHHNKAPDGPKRLGHYVETNVAVPKDFKAYIHATQFVQAEAVATGVEIWRRNWRGPGRYYTAGALVWQINDTWPVISWALVDYNGRAKPGYYRLRRVLAPLMLSFAGSGREVEVWAVNGTLKPVDAELSLRGWSLAGEAGSEHRQTVHLAPNQATSLGALPAPVAASEVLFARLIRDGSALAQATRWPEPPKDFRYPDPRISVRSGSARQVHLRAESPARAVVVTSPQIVLWDDNMIDLLPGEEVTLTAKGRTDPALEVMWLGASQPVQVQASRK